MADTPDINLEYPDNEFCAKCGIEAENRGLDCLYTYNSKWFCADCLIADLERQLAEQNKLHAIANTAIGTATNLMCALGVDWRSEAAPLCNTGGDFNAWKREWDRRDHEAHANLREQRAVMEKLPLLADGVRATPGMTLYYIIVADHVVTYRNVGWVVRDNGGTTMYFSDGYHTSFNWSRAYSTLEAAQAAAGRE